MNDEQEAGRAGPVADDLGVGVIVETSDSDGPFIIGPFPTDLHANVYLSSLPSVLAEDMAVHGLVHMWSPETFAQVQQAWRHMGIGVGQIRDVRGVHRRPDPELPEQDLPS